MSARPPRLWPWLLIPIVAIAAVLTIAVVSFLAAGRVGPWPWWGFFPWFPFVGVWFFLGLLFLFGIFRWSGGLWGWGYEAYRGRGDGSASILRERYARGEISREQFDEMRRALDAHLTHNAYEDDLSGRPGP